MISVVIPTYNEEKYLEDCLRSLARQDYPGNFELIIADSSNDKTKQIAKRYGARIVSMSRSTPALARQAGFAASSGEIIATLDADNIVPSNWLSVIAAEFKKDPKLVCLFGFIQPLEKKIIDKFLLVLLNLANILSFHFLGKLILTGTNQAIRKDTFLKIGGFEPLDLPKVHCDIFDKSDLLLRLKEEGKVKFPSAMKLFFSMRRFHHLGYFAVFVTGLRTWLSLHFFNMGAEHNLKYPRESKRRAFLSLEQSTFLTMMALVVFLAFVGLLTLGPFLYVFTHFLVQPRLIVLKRLAVATVVVVILLLPASLLVWSTTSWAQENEGWQKLKTKISALKLDQKFKNLTDFEILDKLNSFELQKLFQREER